MNHRPKEPSSLGDSYYPQLQLTPAESKCQAQFTRAEKDALKLGIRTLKDDLELINRRLSERALVGLSDTRLDQVKRDLSFEITQLAGQVRRLQESDEGPFSVVERCNSLQKTLQDTRLQLGSESDGIRESLESLQRKFNNLDMEVRTSITETRECARRQAQMESRLQTVVDRMNTIATRYPADQANELHTSAALLQIQQSIDQVNKRVRDLESAPPQRQRRREMRSSMRADDDDLDIWSSDEGLRSGGRRRDVFFTTAGAVQSDLEEDELSSLSGLSLDDPAEL